MKAFKHIIAASLLLACSVVLVLFVVGCASAPTDKTQIRVASLRGPTSIGLAPLMTGEMKNVSTNKYNFSVYATVDEISAKIVSNDIDIALIPANVASILYGKTNGSVNVLNINTLGVLYLLGYNTSIKSFADLENKTIYAMGAGTTPQYITEFLLDKYKIAQNVNIEYKSQAQEILSLLTNDKDALAILPEPYVSTALSKNTELKILVSLQDEWSKFDSGTICTGVTIVRTGFLIEHKTLLNNFLKDQQTSVNLCSPENEACLKTIVDHQIIPNKDIAKEAIPNCNIACITGEELKTKLDAYLHILFDKNPSSVGGKIPDANFYYLGQ
ncbi:MAG: ABC transporter substrate-binding protein [Coriobacteriales bacterium]|nr:ABC transporter substrate-binding protein [Coriobacteriales bacterium]